MGRLLRMPEVESRVGLARQTIYRKIKEGSFPKSMKIGARAVAWREEDIQQWVKNCPEANA